MSACQFRVRMGNDVMKRLLFVDDDVNLLMGLRRGLHSKRTEWEMEFVDSGNAALAAMTTKPFDVVVSDMRMPGMDGSELLNRVQERFPQTIRILLSGQSDRESILKSIAPSHQYLSKPCDIHQLAALLTQTIALTDLLENPAVKSFTSRLSSLPSLPSLYLEMTTALRAADPSPARIAGIIAQDMGMTAKILQLANSARSGIRGEVTQAQQAVMLLGLDTVQALVLSLGVFSSFGQRIMGHCAMEALWQDSSLTSLYSRAIARAEGVELSAMGSFLSAGLLHDIGKLIIASSDPELYRTILETVRATGKAVWEVEQELLGCTHAEIGAYLLGIWGLPVQIVEAVAWHNRPSLSPVRTFSPLVAVHVATAMCAKKACASQGSEQALDMVFVERLGLTDRLQTWIAACEEVGEQRQAV